jgi:hypothetical protein
MEGKHSHAYSEGPPHAHEIDRKLLKEQFGHYHEIIGTDATSGGMKSHAAAL